MKAQKRETEIFPSPLYAGKCAYTTAKNFTRNSSVMT